MTKYEFVKGRWKNLSGFDGAPVLHPRNQCKYCGEPIQGQYRKCYFCKEGRNAVRTHIERVYTVSVYFKQRTEGHEFSKELLEAKEGDHKEKMAKVLKWGIDNLGLLSSTELLVVPPSGSGADYNHMVEIGKVVSDLTGKPLCTSTYKEKDYQAQKELPSEERIENVRDGVGCDKDLSEYSSAAIIDDIVTTCATMSDTARAVKESGVDRAFGLGIARSVSCDGLVHAHAMREV
ncbi:ComF family protein [Halopiger xanaduensis]|uniref:Phosphoribosyltransferase n=1 Tax=Halopiger xanaduensis (strain DSM 18323 / JCM 14033 / SH-6) TaxID=797210 RepID=F8DDS1_HALXS|nr:ComF family protein [Halopiger xanaduensis]AEH39174.1 hypothetical protein Halxa_0585 [Halopiger xanaduensis SH-6]